MASVKMYRGSGDAKAAAIQEKLAKTFGFVPEVFQAMGRNGDFLEAALKVAEVAGKGLDPKTKELIIIAVSAVNGCQYCLDAHRAAAEMIEAGARLEALNKQLFRTVSAARRQSSASPTSPRM